MVGEDHLGQMWGQRREVVFHLLGRGNARQQQDLFADEWCQGIEGLKDAL